MKRLLIIVLVLGMGTLGYCFFAFPTYSWHQKMTIEVEADGQVFSGSSVVRVSWRKNDPLGAANGATWLSGIRGESAFVEVPERGVLFGLLSNSGNGAALTADLPTRLMTGRKGLARGEAEFSAVEAAVGKTWPVPLSLYPFLVTFGDINNPKTVQNVEPDNLAATFGPGVSLKRITLEITDEPVTEGKVESVLGWLNSVNRLVEPKPGALLKDTPVEHRLYHLDFMRK